MNEITCLDDLKMIKKNYELNPYKPYYRGQANSSWKLISSLSRIKTSDFGETEIRIIDSFRKEIIESRLELIQTHPTDKFLHGEKWNFLFQSQHLGLPTRLLDWSPSAETALFFASNEMLDQNGKFYVLEFNFAIHYHWEKIREYRLFDNDPEKFDKVILINQALTAFKDNSIKLGEKRMGSQFGRFLFQPIENIKIPFEETCRSNPNFSLIEYIIPANAKASILKELNDENYNEESLSITPCEEIDLIIEKIKGQYK